MFHIEKHGTDEVQCLDFQVAGWRSIGKRLRGISQVAFTFKSLGFIVIGEGGGLKHPWMGG